MSPQYAQAQAHETARERFRADPSKCYQRHIREVWAEIDHRPQLTSLKGGVVVEVSKDEAASIILKYEWIAGLKGPRFAMGAGTERCYGLKLDGELLGVVCMNKGVQHEARRICKDPATYEKTIGLCRGACVPHAPKDAGSFLVRHACRLAYRDHGYEVFFAYSDPEAGEIGTIYQAVGWKCIGAGAGRPKGKDGRSFHTDFISPEGQRISTHSIYKLAVKLGWTPECGMSKRAFLRGRDFKDHNTYDKTKWVWFEGPNRVALEADCRWPFLRYPKRCSTE